MESRPLTPRGERLLREELKELLEIKRPEIINAIAEAREHGDLKENSEYHAAREAQSLLEARIKYLESVLSNCRIIDLAKLDVETVVFGAKVTLWNPDTDERISYRIVGEDESDPPKGRISYQAPISRELIGKYEGDAVDLPSADGPIYYEIESIDFTNEPVDAE